MIPEITKTVRLHFAARKRTWYVFNHALSDFFPQYYFALFLTSSWDGRILREKSSFMCIVNALSLLQLISFMSHNWIQFCVSIFFIKCHTGKDYCGIYSNFKKPVVSNYRLLVTVGCLIPIWTNRSENQVPFLYPLSCRIECLNVLMLLFYFFFCLPLSVPDAGAFQVVYPYLELLGSTHSRQDQSPDSYQFDSDGDIVRCGDSKRVGKRKETLLFSPCQYLLLLTIYSEEKTGNEWERRFWWKTWNCWSVKLLVGWDGRVK